MITAKQVHEAEELLKHRAQAVTMRQFPTPRRRLADMRFDAEQAVEQINYSVPAFSKVVETIYDQALMQIIAHIDARLRELGIDPPREE